MRSEFSRSGTNAKSDFYRRRELFFRLDLCLYCGWKAKREWHSLRIDCNVRFMDRKDELRNKALDYCLAHGIAELSLRPLALKVPAGKENWGN